MTTGDVVRDDVAEPGRRRPPGRYDPPSRLLSRTLAVVLGLLFAGFVLVVALTLYDRYGADDVRVRTLGYTVLSDREVRVEAEVTAPAGKTAWCLLRARQVSGAEAGRDFARVDIPAQGSRTVRLEHVVTTSARAVTGEATRCLLSPPTEEDLRDARSPTSAP